jgi:hypothetical protein
VQAAVLGNVGSIIIFRVGGEDAVKLKPEMAPIFDTKDMINLGMTEFYIKMTIDGETYDPFSAQTLKIMPPPHRSFKEEIVKRSREKYSIPVDDAKKLIMEEESTIIRSAQEKAIIEGRKPADIAPPPEPIV